ncbi:hypothetical protein [Simplicispira lacusdiani]|uniref:hypothetical protein n=1 Tax=Simplicispira lacusdiani TaxID=2213010 RepID=UPI000E753FEA|nr:hypothetical protein [Simplicispira lacusdiani]
MSGDAIVHEGRERYSVPVHRAALRDSRLSWGARGLFAFLWDLPSNWTPCAAHLKKMGPDGRDAVRARLAELEAVGALRFERIPGEGGRFSGTRWVILSPAAWAREAPLRGGEGCADADQD